MTPTLELEPILIFSVESNHFCAAMQQIESVLDYQPLSTLPNTPPYIAGGFWYQGIFVHVINVRKKFALPDRDNPKSGSFITTHIDNELLAFWVDCIEDITDTSKYSWQKLPVLNTGVFSRALLQYQQHRQQIVLEVNFEKLKNTDSLNVADLVKTLSFSDPTIKQSSNIKTSKTQAPLRPHSERHIIGNSTASPLKRKKPTSVTLFVKTGAEKKLTASTTINFTPSKTTTTPKIFNKQATENNKAEKAIPAKIENIFTKIDNTHNVNKPTQTAPRNTTAIEHDDTNLNIAPLLLLASVISALLFFTFGTYVLERKVFEQTLVKISTRDKLKEQHKAITIETQHHPIVIQRQQRSKTLATSAAIPNTLGGNILFMHTVVKGDTLWHIAKQYQDNPYLYPELAKLSKIKNPNLIYPGDTVTIKRRR